jgi:glyoxylase-like metal-dependent hydrolase (beta-lactamase superfamily II)
VQQTFAKVFSLPQSEFKADGSDFDLLLKSGEELKLGTLSIRILHVPGHTPDHICYLIGDSIFVGDTIFMVCSITDNLVIYFTVA